MEESNGRLLPGFMDSVTCGLTADEDQLRNHTLVLSIGLYLTFYLKFTVFACLVPTTNFILAVA